MHYIIYVPGLGDTSDKKRRIALSQWRIFGVKTELLPMNWHTDESYEHKIIRLQEAIKNAEEKGYIVSLIGESAGATIALAVAVRIPSLYKVLTVAGVLGYATPINPSLRRRLPVFGEAVDALETIVPKLHVQNITVIQALRDASVPKQYNVIKGADVHTFPVVGHVLLIALSLTIFSPYIIAFIKRKVA